MAKTFQCPACGKAYPLVPTLVGRPVRCSNCRKAFKLQDSGTAVLVEAESAPASATPQPPAAATPPAPPPPRSPAARKSTSARRKSPRPEADAARKSLSAAAEAALEHVGGDAPGAPGSAGGGASAKEGTQDRKHSAPHKRQRTGRQKTGRPGEPPPGFDVVTTDQGARESQAARLFALLTLLILGGIGLVGWWWLTPDPQRQALAAFAADPPVDVLDPPHRHRHHLARSWLATLNGEHTSEIILDLEEADFGIVFTISATGWRAFHDEHLDGLELDRDLAMFIAPDDAERARELIEEQDLWLDREQTSQALRDADIRHLRFEELRERLGADFNDQETLVLSALLVGEPNHVDPLAVLASSDGARLEFQGFRGRDGRRLEFVVDDYAAAYSVTDGHRYWGALMRILGAPEAPADWRVLAIWRLRPDSQVQLDTAWHNPLRRAAEQFLGLHAKDPTPAIEGVYDREGNYIGPEEESDRRRPRGSGEDGDEAENARDPLNSDQ